MNIDQEKWLEARDLREFNQAIESAEKYYHDWKSTIYWGPVVREIARHTDGFGPIAARESVLRFPDGSVCLSTKSDYIDSVRALYSVRRTGGTDADGNVCGRIQLIPNTLWRALRCFPRRGYDFPIPEEYLNRIGGEMSLLVGPDWMWNETLPGEYNLSNLSVRVRFWRMLPASERAGFEAALMAWEKSVCDDHALGPVQARLKPGTLSFAKREVDFRIDASGANQDVLNWLVLSILNFGVEKHPVTEVRFAETA